VEITIVGLTSEVEAAMFPGERLAYNGETRSNIKIEVNTTKGKRNLFATVQTNPDANRHYAFTQKVTIKEDSRVSLESTVEILMKMETTFGNWVWTLVERSVRNAAEPIILDKYSSRAGSLKVYKGKKVKETTVKKARRLFWKTESLLKPVNA
jgi:hypothetical protein